MAIKFSCDCGHRIGAPDSFAGRKAHCPGCGAVVEIPAASVSPPPTRPPSRTKTDFNLRVVAQPAEPPAAGADADLLFGRLAVKAGYVTEEQVQVLLGSQARAAAAGASVTLGELCQSRGLLTSAQVQSLLLAQGFALLRTEDKLLGRLAVRNGFATEDDVKAALDEQKREYGGERALPRRLGEILVEMGTFTDPQLQALLSAQARLAGTAKPMPASSEEANTGWLVQEAGDGAGSRFRLGKRTVLGRQPENEVPVEDDQASRQHARIEYIPLGRQHVLTDLNSRNGTCVNGEPVTGPVALADGDRIQIGETVLLYRAVAAEGVSPDETTAAPPVRMGSQLRRETAAMRAARPLGATALAQEGAAGEADPSVAPPAPEAEEDSPQESEVAMAPRRAGAFSRRKAVVIGCVLTLSIATGAWLLSNRGEGEQASVAATGGEPPTAQATPSVSEPPADASGPAGSATTTSTAPPMNPSAPTTGVATAAPPTLPQDADQVSEADEGRESQREARARIEQARGCIARGDWKDALELLQEAQSLDPASETEVASLIDVAISGSGGGGAELGGGGAEPVPPATPEPPDTSPNPQENDTAGGTPDGAGADALLATAQALDRASKQDQAIKKYREILASYPGTAGAATAKGRLVALRLACIRCQGRGMECRDCDGMRTTYTTCAMCGGAGKGAGSMQAGKAGRIESSMCHRCNGCCKHDEMCRKCGGVGRVRCSVCWALPALEGGPSSQRGKKEPVLLDDWKETLALMLSGREGSSVGGYAEMERDLKAKRSGGGAGESPAAVADRLGAVLMAQGEFKEASGSFAKSLSLRKQALGKDAPEVGDSLLAFGILDAAQGNAAAALLNLDQAHLVYMTAWNAARNKEFFLLVWGAATEDQPEGLAKDAMEVVQSEGRRQVKEEIDAIAARMERANLLRDLIETCELRWRFKSPVGTGEEPPPSASEGDEAKARTLLAAAEQFERNGMRDRAIEKLNEVVSKYPETETAVIAKGRIKGLQATGGPSK